MKLRHFFILVFLLTLLFWYPGDSEFIKLFSIDNNLFRDKESTSKANVEVLEVPYVLDAMVIPQVTAQALYIVVLDSFTPIYAKNEHIKLPTASTVKMITALTSMDVYNLNEVIKVKGITDVGQTINLVNGEKITVENLLYGILVGSGNDAAYALANGYKDGFSGFISKMNKKANEIGMKDTVILDPAGLDRSGQYTTAYDLALAGRELIHNQTLAKIVSTKQITISDVDFVRFHQLNNINVLLGEIPGLGGLKTGYTETAGQHLVSLYKKDNREFIIVVLKSEDRFEDTKNVVNWINTNVGYIQGKFN